MSTETLPELIGDLARDMGATVPAAWRRCRAELRSGDRCPCRAVDDLDTCRLHAADWTGQ